MPTSWRISVRELDRSQTLIPEVGSTGAMVIEARRGPRKPVFISSRQETRLIDLFGTPSVDYPDVWEAIQFNREAPIWIASPYADDDTFSGVVVSADGTSQLSSAGPTKSEIDNYSFASDTEYFALFTRSPSSEDNWGVQVTYNSTNQLFTVQVHFTEDEGSTWSLKEEYTVSPIAGKTDGFGQNVYVEEVFNEDDNDFLIAKANSSADLTGSESGFTDDTDPVLLTGGDRSDPDASDRTDVWDEFQKARKYDSDVFMDNSTLPEIPAKFDTLRTSYQKYAFYITALPMGEDVSTATATKEGYGINNAGLAFYWNHGRVRDTYNGGSFWTSLIGRVGAKLAQMDDIYNGGAPAWIDENGHGGQLGGGIIELEFDPTEDQLENLDGDGINPIIFDPNFGVLISSQRTAQSPSTLSDNSWIAHRRLFDYIISNIIAQALPYQLVKLNDEPHRQRVASQAELVTNPVLAEGLLSEVAVICDESNNTDTILAQRKFVLDVIVKVTPYSETVLLRFTNINQQTTVQELTQ